MREQSKKQPRRCDWMTDQQLLIWIEATSRYLADAMAEARERGLLLRAEKGRDDGTQG